MIMLNKSEIKYLLDGLDLVYPIKEGFIQYSKGKCVIPPVGELLFNNPPGDVHIKYGYITDEKYYVIKIASGFPKNEKLNISNGQGMILLFDQSTGQPLITLLDDAILTDIRTAIAGQICAEIFTNKIKSIGVIGTGRQARLQVIYLKNITNCKTVNIWGRNKKKSQKYKDDLSKYGFNVRISKSVKELAEVSNLIITTTSSDKPLLHGTDIKLGTHITAVGADTASKRELDISILKRADLIIADSISQCKLRGEVSHALSKNLISPNEVIELGSILSGKRQGRTSKEQISVADLTGIAVQDLQIAKAVYEKYLKVKNEI
jgi:ornithine cyclodeaminase